MRRLLPFLCACALAFAPVTSRASSPPLPQTPWWLYSIPPATAGSSPTAPHVASTAALQSVATTTYPSGVWRDDYANGKGAPPLFYEPSASACSVNLGAGDNGSQVQSADGKCWLARFPAGVMDVAEFGGVGDGSTDDYTPITNDLAACAAVGGGRVVIGPRQYYSSLSQTIPANCSLEGNANMLPWQTFSQTVNTQAYTLLLGSGAQINLGTGTGTRQSSALRGLNIIPKAYTPPTTMQQALAQIAAFAGTGIVIPHTSNASIIENVAIGGFNLCIDSEAYDVRMHNVIGDCTNGFLVNNGTNYNWFNNVENFPFLTGGVTGGDDLTFTVTGVANDGSGQAQLAISSITSGLANGNTIYVGGAAFLTARSDLIGKWTISNVSVGGSTTTFSLVGSSYGAQTFTAAVVSGSQYVTGAGVTAALGYFGGATASDTGSCIPGGTTVKWINPDANTLFLSQAATCSSPTDSVTATPVAYTSGGQIDFNAEYRSGYGFKDTNSQGMMFVGTFDFGHQIQYDLSTSSFGPNFIGFGCDGSPNAPDPTRICINVETSASMPSFTNGFITDAGIPLKQNTSGSLSGAQFRTVLNDTVVYCNNYLCDEILSGGVQYGAGVQFRSVYQSFVGNSAVLQTMATYNTTASPQMIYQSAGDTANVNSNLLGNMSIAGTFGAGGAGAFGGTVNSIGTGNTVGDYVYDTTAGSANNSWFSPYLWLMNRSNGSSVGLQIETANAGSWGGNAGAGSISITPNGAYSLTCYTDGRCSIAQGNNATLPGANLEIFGTLRLSGGTPTIAANACGTTTQGTVTTGSTDESGNITVGTASVTSCTVSFSAALPSAPRECEITPANAAAAAWATTGAYVAQAGLTTAHFVISGSNLSSASYNYECM